jgi:hypothetical protein
MQPATKRYYVYILSDNGTPFYVGKGTRDRIHRHEKEARDGCVCPKCSRIRSIWTDGRQVVKEKVLETNIEREALDHEIALIATIGRGNLCNRSNGGEAGGRPEYISIDALRRHLRLEFKERILPKKTGLDRWYWRKDMQVWVEDRVRRIIREEESLRREIGEAYTRIKSSG